MVEFEFKWTNQETTPHYRPPTLAAGGSVGGTTRAVAPGPAPTQALSLAPTRWQPCRPLALPPQPAWVVASMGQALPPPLEPA
jgi:hypothetical protein